MVPLHSSRGFAMAPKQFRHVDAGADLALRQQLAEIKRVPLEQVGRIRMTPEKLPSLVDVGVILTGSTSHDVAQILRRMFAAHIDLGTKCSQVSFGGRGGNRESLVPKDLAALVEIIFLLPGRAAAQVRQAAAQIFVRYLGGDLSLVQEVERLHHVQAFLRENAPEHPLRVFGEAVENSEGHELKRKRGEAELAEAELRIKKASVEARCLELQQQEVAARVAIALEEKQRATEARRIANLREWLQLAGSDGAVVQVAPADRVAVNDMMRTLTLGGSGAEAGLGAAICLEAFLRERGVRDATAKRGGFGKAVLKVWRERHPDQQPPKKQVFVNGQERTVNAYWETHMDILEEAFEAWAAKNPASDTPSTSTSGQPMLHLFQSPQALTPA